jgi:hypothetical protein
MATSPPADADPPAPDERRLDTLAGQAEAIDALIDLAQQKLVVFDRDLAELGWSGARRADRLEAFLRRRHAKLSLIVHDTRHLEASCPRILALLKVYGHAMQVWRTGLDARGALDALVIADDRHYLHRYHVDQPRATFAIGNPAAAKPLGARFEEIWATGEPALGGSVLGL